MNKHNIISHRKSTPDYQINQNQFIGKNENATTNTAHRLGQDQSP